MHMLLTNIVIGMENNKKCRQNHISSVLVHVIIHLESIDNDVNVYLVHTK